MDSIPKILSDIRGYGSSSDPIPKILSDIRGYGSSSDPIPKIWSDIRGMGYDSASTHKILDDIRGTGNSNDSIAKIISDIRDLGILSPDPPDNGPQSVTNVEKLSLDPSTAVGTQVSVSDGFVVSGFGDARDGFYFPSPADSTIFIQRLPFLGDGTDTRAYSDGTWHIGDDNNGYTDADSSGGANPWDTTYAGLTLTHPAIQALQSPSSVQGGVFVAGGVVDGVYSARGLANSKEYYDLVGTGSYGDNVNGGNSEVNWQSDLHAIGIVGVFQPGWVISDDGGNPIYYSTSVVATPDLASNWKNASDDSDASITVTSVAAGQIAAGIKTDTDTFVVNGSLNGRLSYSEVTAGVKTFSWSLNHGVEWEDETATNVNGGNVAFPFDGTPEVTLTRDDVASEQSWTAP